MEIPRKILVPCDLSPRANEALSYAALLCGHFGAKLVLATNVNLPERSVLERFGGDDGLTVVDAGQVALKRLAAERAPGVAFETALTFRDFPTDGVLEVIDTHDVDLVVMASHGRSGIKRVVLGSVAEAVARRSDVPLLIVPVRDFDE